MNAPSIDSGRLLTVASWGGGMTWREPAVTKAG